MTVSLNAQWVLKCDSLRYNDLVEALKLGESNELFHSNSTGHILLCDLLFKNVDSTNYIVEYAFREDLPNHIYFRMNYSDGRSLTGWFHKVEQIFGKDTTDCWVEDLIWQMCDKNGEVVDVTFYSNGIEEITPIIGNMPKREDNERSDKE